MAECSRPSISSCTTIPKSGRQSSTQREWRALVCATVENSRHQFREKKPIILFSSRADFAQNNVTGDLGEGVGGVTESGRHRLILPLTGDLGSFEHVLAHELVHEFQYDVFSRGRAGANQQGMERLNPPLWFMEGMAEYLSIGPNHPLTAGWLRDAAVNGKVPTIEQMTERPDEYFPYRYGESLWQYVGERWGDQAIGEILRTTMSGGVARAFQRELGMSLTDLSSAWREACELAVSAGGLRVAASANFCAAAAHSQALRRRNFPRAGSFQRRQLHRVPVQRKLEERRSLHRPVARQRAHRRENQAS
jgi:hypothetical protein